MLGYVDIQKSHDSILNMEVQSTWWNKMYMRGQIDEQKTEMVIDHDI